MKQFITVEKYNTQWESEFCKLQTLINNVMGELIFSIKHVGSTSVKGLASKPILDVDVVIEDYDVFPKVIKRLEQIGYFHQEEWSFKGREALGERINMFRGTGRIQFGWNIIYMYAIRIVKS